MISARVKRPLVSIIIPAFNEEKNITVCLDSIAHQDYKNTEVILVDDASLDQTVQFARKMGKKNNLNLRVITQTVHKERGFTRNQGAELSKGDYLLFIDADMKLEGKVISQCMKAIEDSNLGAVIVPEESFGEGFWADCRRLEKRCYIGDNRIEAARFFIKKSFWNVGGWDKEMISGEDWDLTKRVGKKYVIGRIQAKILHNEGKLTLWNVIRKKFYYASNSGFYLRKYPLKVTDLLFFVIRPAYLRNWKLLFANPLTTIGMFFLKFIEIVAGGLGFLYSKLLSLH